MGKLFRQNFRTQAVILIVLTFLGFTNKSSDCIVDLKTKGHYEINFDPAEKVIKSKTEFNRTSQTNIKDGDIQKDKISKEFHRVDNFSNLTIATNQKKDSINRNYNIKTTIYLDTVVFNGSHKFYKNNGVNHSFTGHSKHEITEIINKIDTLNHIVSTTFDFTLIGEIKGKSNDLLIDYLIEKELLSGYLPDILKAIMDEK